jgi:hypothetical protein
MSYSETVFLSLSGRLSHRPCVRSRENAKFSTCGKLNSEKCSIGHGMANFYTRSFGIPMDYIGYID